MKKYSPSKDGAALVIALGFLAILTVMVFAFAVSTRTDRVAGRAYLDNARANQLLHTALTRAMEDIDFTFGTNYPQRLALHSGNGGVPIIGSVNFSTEENYLPLGNADIETAYSEAMNAANWLPISDNGTQIGRVAYVIVNTSGLLDANAVGTITANNKLLARSSGLSPKEIQLSPELLPEFNASGMLVETNGARSATDNPNLAFVHNRDNAWQRFETLRDIKTLNDEKRGGVIGGEISAFNVFSLFPTNTIQGLELTETIDENQFEKILIKNCNFSRIEAEHIIDNYFDYIDADHIPRNLSGSSPEAVPMINEIWLENVKFDHNVSDPTNVNYGISGELYIETWFPFDEPHPSGELLEVVADDLYGSSHVEIIAGKEFALQPGYITVVVAYTNQSKALIIPLAERSSEQSTDKHFTQYSYGFDFQKSMELGAPLAVDEPLSISLQNKEIELIIGAPVDRVENTKLKFNISEGKLRTDMAYGCDDPRLNHDFGMHWNVLDTATPNEINTLNDWGEETDLDKKERIQFFVSNQPMTNAAELGHLSTGKPWDTIRLYAGDEDPDPVLDYFYTNPTNTPTRPGLININSPHANVLATAFYKTPILESSEISVDQALALGQTLAAMSNSAENKRSHIGHALSTKLPNWKTLTDAQKDSIVGNTYRLFGSRDTSYTILLVAQAGTDHDKNGLDDTEIKSAQQAIVNVWRDPASRKAAVTFFGLTDTLRSTTGGDESWRELLNAFAP